MAEGEVNITAFDDAGTLNGTEKIYLVRGTTDYNTTPDAIKTRVKGDIVNDLTTGGATKFASAETVKTLDAEKAPSANPTFTGNVVVPTADANNEAVNKGQMDAALSLKAPLANPTFTGNVVVPLADASNEAVNKGQMDAADALIYTDIYNVTGAVSHYKRVLADAGGVLDRTWLLRAYEEYIKQRPETLRLYIPELGAKLRTSGLNRFGVKAYDMSANAKDAVQLTTATQPYMTIGAAPNARLGMRFVQGQTQTGLMDFDDVAFAAGDSWTLTTRVKINKREGGTVNLGGGVLYINNTTVILINGAVQTLNGAYSFECGRTYTIEFQYSNGVGLILVNGIPIVTSAVSGGITFGKISYDTLTPFDGSLYAFHLTNTRKSAYQSQLDHTFLSAMFPDMESVVIGNQVWTTSNFEGIVAGDGTVVQEVQSAATAADATNIYNATYAATTGTSAVKDLAATKAAAMWCHYDNLAANGAVYGKLYNWYAVHLFDLYPPVKGWRVPSKLDFDQLVAVNGGTTVAGGRLKAKFGGLDNANASNESGFSTITGGMRVSTGAFSSIGAISVCAASTGLYLTVLATSADSTIASINEFYERTRMVSIRLLRNEPAGDNEKSYTSGLFTTDITSTPKQIPISFGRMVDAIRIKSENALTAIEAKLYNAAGTAVATLITAKTVAAGATMMFPVIADYAGLLQDGSVRVTAAGNSGAAVGMEIEVLTHKGVLS